MLIRSRLFALALYATCVAASGNPIAIGNWAYIASEHLKVSLTDATAVIDGSFTFRSTGKSGKFADADGEIHIPLWLPDVKSADPQTAQLIKLCPSGKAEKVVGPLSEALEMAIVPRVKVSGKDLVIDRVELMPTPNWGNKNHADPTFQRQGYCCLLLYVSIPTNLISRGQIVSISYRQPLHLTRGGAEFHYVPIFHDLPSDLAIRELSRYSATVHNDTAQTFTLGGAMLRPSASMVLPLSGGDAITLQSVPAPSP